ncbi:SPOR domain-containing protein [Primorskyibacter sp. 2E107]|uniref:SPOR domain-containing protein n=1 Tax=Primorskyibacter sp. 2E107 TaxID=3403458 RepID=UPI003AF8D8FD
MTDYTYQGAANAAPAGRSAGSIANIAGAMVSLALVAGVGVWGYKTISRDVSGIPVVRATADPMRVAPDNPGGELADHQGLAVNRVAGSGKAEGPAERLVLAPRPAGLSEEDVAQGLLATVAPRKDAPRPVAVQPAPELSAPEPVTALNQPKETDPVAALVDQLSAGAAPLSALAPGEDKPVQAEVVEETAAVEEADAPKPGPGLARSLRPKQRPSGIQTASLSAVAPETIAAAVAAAEATELDAASLPTGTRLVQIGAFDSPETARAEWTRLESRFGDYLDGKDRVIQKASSGGRVFYRLRAHGFEDLSDARRFCAAFVAQNVDCIPVVTR